MGRSLYLVDIENLAGSAKDTHQVALDRLGRCLHGTGWKPGDLAVVASTAVLWKKIAWDAAQFTCQWVVVRRGRDNADHALLEAISGYDTGTFERVVIASGDHIFAGLASELVKEGVQVVVAANAGKIASELRHAALETIELPPIPMGAAVE